MKSFHIIVLEVFFLFYQMTFSALGNCEDSLFLFKSPRDLTVCMQKKQSQNIDLINSITHFKVAPLQAWNFKNQFLIKDKNNIFVEYNPIMNKSKTLHYSHLIAESRLLYSSDSLEVWKMASGYLLTSKISQILWKKGLEDSIQWIQPLPNQSLIIGTPQELFRVGIKGLEDVKANKLGNCEALRTSTLFDIQSSNGLMWFKCDHQDLAQMHLASGRVEYFKHFPLSPTQIYSQGAGALLNHTKELYYYPNLQSIHRWKQSFTSPIQASVIFQDKVWVLTEKNLQILDINTGKKKWDFPFSQSEVAWIALSQNQLVVIRKNGDLFAFNKANQNTWTYHLGERLNQTPLLKDNKLSLLSEKTLFVTLDLSQNFGSFKIKQLEQKLNANLKTLPPQNYDTQNQLLAQKLLWLEPGHPLALQVKSGQYLSTKNQELSLDEVPYAKSIRWKKKNSPHYQYYGNKSNWAYDPITQRVGRFDLLNGSYLGWSAPIKELSQSAFETDGDDLFATNKSHIYHWSKNNLTPKIFTPKFTPKSLTFTPTHLIINTENGNCVGISKKEMQLEWIISNNNNNVIISNDLSRPYFWMLSEGMLYKMDVYKGDIISEVMVPNHKWQKIVPLENSVVLISNNGVVVSLDLNLNNLRFSRAFYAPIEKLISLPQGLFVSFKNQNLMMIDDMSGAILWTHLHKGMYTSMAQDGRWFYLAQGNDIFAYSLLSGQPIGRVQFHKPIRSIQSQSGQIWITYTSGESLVLDRSALSQTKMN